MKKYYKIVAKCGHLGVNKYYEGTFYEIAANKEYAAFIVRGRGRVKHDHKDAIISVDEITYNEYKMGMELRKREAYFNCVNKQEQELVWSEIDQNKIKFEEKIEEYSNESISNRNVYFGKEKIRKPSKFIRLNKALLA